MDAFLQSFRYAWRRLLRQPAATLLAVLALGLGIGQTTTMFGAVYGTALRDLPVPEGGRVVTAHYSNPSQGQNQLGVSMHDFADWRQQQRSLEGLAAFYNGTINLSDEGYPDRFSGAFISANFLDLLRVRPLLGRGFAAGEDQPGAEPVVILGHDVWRSRYGEDPRILGRTVRVNGKPSTVVGVMEPGFQFPHKEDVWVPLIRDPAQVERGEGIDTAVFGRLADGVTLEQARADLATIARRLAEQYPETNQGLEAKVQPFTEGYIPEEIRRLIVTMLGAVVFVLAIACANVACLLLARASGRTRELATRFALGAGRRQVIWDLLAESLLLSVGGAALGLAIAHWGGQYISRLVLEHPDPPYWCAPGLEAPTYAFVLATTLMAALFAGLVPALQASRTDPGTMLRDESRTASSFRLGRFLRAVVVGEIALACALLVGSGLMVRSIANLRTMDLGFETEGILTARIGLFETVYPEETDRRRFFDNLLERLAATPGVESAALTSSLPTSGRDGTAYAVEGKVYEQRNDYPATRLAAVSSNFFATFDIPILEGRGFSGQDREETQPVVVVNRSFADQEWPGKDPLGRRIRFGRGDQEEPWLTVVGVAADAGMSDLGDDDQDGIYAPLAQHDRRFLSVAVATRGEPQAFAATLRQTVLDLDRDLPLYWLLTMDEVVAEARFFYDFFGALFATFGLAALLLAAVGIYGIMAFAVGRRTHEIGVRMALGAAPDTVLGMLLRQGTARLLVGLAIGLGLALGVSRLLAAFLFAVDPGDPTTFLGVAVFLTAVTLLACLFPALAARRVDPVEALRHQ